MKIYFLQITVFAVDFVQVPSFQGGLIFMEGVASHGVHDLSCTEVDRILNPNTKTWLFELATLGTDF